MLGDMTVVNFAFLDGDVPRPLLWLVAIVFA